MFQNFFQLMNNTQCESGLYILDKIYNEITELPKDKHIEKIINILVDFFTSNEFILFCVKFDDIYLSLIIKICESYEKSLFLKILLPLLEKLKSRKFENQLKIVNQKIQIKKEKSLNLYNNQTKTDLKKNPKIVYYAKIFSASLNILFGMDVKNDLNSEEKKIFIKESINTLFESFLNLIKLDENLNKDIFKFMVDVNSLNYTKDLYQILNIIIYSIQFEKKRNDDKKCNNIYRSSQKEIETLLDDTFIKLIINKTLSQNYFWLLYERNKHSKKEEYNFALLKGEKVDKEKLSFNAFEVIDKKGENDLINICQNLLTNEKIVILKINNEENKGQLTINEIREEINKEIDDFYFFYIKIEKEIIFEKSVICI